MSFAPRYLLAVLLVLGACSDPASPAVDDALDTGDAANNGNNGNNGNNDSGNNGNNGADAPPPDVPDAEPDVVEPDVGEPDVPDGGGNNGEASCTRDADCGDGAVFCRIDVGLCDDPNAQGVCTPRPRACPGALEPVCGCDDRTHRNECQAAQSGISLRHDGACRDDPVRCGRAEDCPEGSFCECAGEACERSVCVARPEACDEVLEPVCGCDGITYDNDCERQRAGACLVAQGDCPPSACGGIQAMMCPEGRSCDIIAGACNARDAPGVCQVLSEDCQGLDVAEVCGCDGQTYPGDCSRRNASVRKDHDGACDDPRCEESADCEAREFCALPDGCEDGAVGVCEMAPQDCTGEPQARVCGCDERTYENDCERRQAGVGKLRDGRCDAQACTRREDCPRNREYCDLGLCVDPNSEGLCLERPRECRTPVEGEEVCGCDGQTYPSDCRRQQAEASLFAMGPCRVCSPSVSCIRGSFCEYTGGDCGQPRSVGLCADVPTACPRNVDPVCGCNGRTYSNDCNRRQAGVALDHTGGCR